MSTRSGSRGERRPSTIRDVASRAGVSKSTVSRALLGQSGVSPSNLDKIAHAVRELDFVPNQIARSLTVSSPAILGLLLRSSASGFYAQLAGAFEEQAGLRGYEVLSVASGHQPAESAYRSLMVLAGLRTAGIVVAAPTVSPRIVRQVASRVPLVLVGQLGQPANPTVPFVALDPGQGGTLIDHVVGFAHTSIALTAYAAERAPTQWARIQDMKGKLDARRLRNRVVIIEPRTDLVGVVDELYRSGFTAILCNDDWTALDAMVAATRLGLAVPRDLSIAGHDATPPFDHEAIGLTTYRVPVADMAAAAVDHVLKLVESEAGGVGGTFLFGELVPGRTTGPSPTK